MATEFTVTIRATSIQVYPGQEAIIPLQPLLNLLTYEDEYSEQTKTLGFMLDAETDILYLHKGVDPEYLRRLLIHVKFIMDPCDPCREMKFDYEEIIPPRDKEQVDAINFIVGIREHLSNAKDSQVFLVKGTGKGKTYCSDVGMCLYHKKTLIIMHRDTLRTQWVDSIHKMTGMTSRDVFEITSGEELCKIANNEHDYDFDVYLMTHATFRAGLKRVGSISKMSNVIKNLGIGLKIIDEAHLEFRDTLMMDFCFNVQRNLYLTATDGRSSKDENSIFKHVFANTTFYKPSSLLTADDTKPSKWVEYNIVEINTHVNPKLYRFKIAGGKGMSVASYGKWVIQHDKKQTHFKVIRDLLRQMFENDPQSKVLVFLPLIDLCTECAYFLSKYFDYDDTFEYSLNIRTINSKNSTIENERAQRADIIVTTIASCGVGKDIKGLTGVISCSPFCSSLTATQVLGRLRYCGKTCYYYDIFDASVQMDRFWLKARSKTLKRLAMKTNYLSWSEEENTDNDKV
jgi:superfamily II DNA or RNA helicase